MTRSFLFSGFGGQGLLFAGKFVAYKGLLEDKHISWLPSYGPEMRGGTASCSVIVGDEPVGSPVVLNPDVLVAMNLPSLDRYEDAVVPGGYIFADSSLIERKVKRTDVNVVYIPATQMANENGLDTLANMIITGNILKTFGQAGDSTIDAALGKCISARHADLLEFNKKAIDMGIAFEG